MSFLDVKVGDKVTRMLAGTIEMEMDVIAVDDNLIYTKGGWTFDRDSGVEEDSDLGWGVAQGITGSYLVKK